MKNFLILSLTLSFATAAFAQADTTNANRTVNGLPDGKWIQYFNNWKGAEVGAYDNKAPFYRISMYKAGKHIGTVKEYYRTGELWYEAFYNSDWTKVIQRDYYSNGKLILRDSAMDDKGNEKITTYHDDGKVDAKFILTINVLGDCKLDILDKDGDLSIEETGVISSEIQKYDETTGNLKMVRVFTYDQNKGEKFTLESNNRVWSLLVKNIKSRLEKEYYDNGILKSETPYLEGIKHGVVKEYYKSGTIQSETTYSNRLLNGPAKKYDENGKLTIETPWVDGKITGVVKHYYPNGVVQSETFFSENYQVGDPTLYDVDGHKIK
jgi:antitoxin component YwqK of YwqJK toxin-antitoxin module